MKKTSPSVFVIQKHAASHLHYDFRLTIGDKMKSWSIPKGPSLHPRDRRLAVLTKDHPLSYRNFEGVIPKGEYGAGVVMVWDRGRYRNKKTNKQGEIVSMETCFRRGVIEVYLSGKKVKGGFALIRMQGKNWLFLKMRDCYAEEKKNIVKSAPKSVKSGKTMEQIRRAATK